MIIRAALPTTLILMASPALADITADDVWANTVAFYQATGGTLRADLNRDGNTVFVENSVLTYSFPFDTGSVRIGLPPMTMIEQGDGSVTQQVPKSFDVMLDLDVTDLPAPDDLSFTTTITQTDFSAVASGTPGDITYTRSAGAYEATLEFDLDDEGFEGIGMSFEFTGDGYTQTTRVTEGDLIEVVSDTTTAPMRYSFRSDEGYGDRSEGVGTYGTTVNRFSMALPANGVDISNLAPALSAGMFLEGVGSSESASDENTHYADDLIVMLSTTSIGQSETTFRLSADGFELAAQAEDMVLVEDSRDFIELIVAVEIDGMSGSYRIPLLAAAGTQTMNLAMQLDGLTLSDATWDTLDADVVFPREAANLTLDLTSDIRLDTDLVDFAALEAAFGGQNTPIAPQNLTLKAFAIDAAGVSASGSGAFTFDNDDLTTFDGVPRPQGNAEIQVTGANALLEKLAAAGYLPDDEAGMARMMMGMFTRSTGDDQLTSTLEVDPEGQVLVNGERIR